jgi:AcrR family transcriptional regulator
VHSATIQSQEVDDMATKRSGGAAAGPGRRKKGKVAGSEEKRAEIRNAAYRCFSHGGYHKTSVEKICATLGISKGSFYWYFSGKQAVFTSILEDWAERVEIGMARQFHDALEGFDRDGSMASALVKESRRGRYIMPIWLEFLAHATRVPKLRDGLANFHTRIRDFIKQIIEPVLPDDFDDKDRDALSTVILASFIGIVAQELIDPKRANSKETLHRFMKILKYYTSEPKTTVQHS